jgi:hypothetical protein
MKIKTNKLYVLLLVAIWTVYFNQCSPKIEPLILICLQC